MPDGVGTNGNSTKAGVAAGFPAWSAAAERPCSGQERRAIYIGVTAGMRERSSGVMDLFEIIARIKRPKEG